MVGIYKITNNINGKFYVGRSNDIERRWKEHCAPNRYKTSNTPVDWAIHKYGKENFSLEILEECSIENIAEREAYWIRETNAVQDGYNCNEGGDLESVGELNPNSKLTEDDVILIRKTYNERSMSQKELYELFKDKISFFSFQAIWQGKVWAHIMPEVYTEENKEYYRKYASTKKVSNFSEDEVLELRKKYVTSSAKELYSPYKDKISFQSFQSLLSGRSYKHLPYYHKKTQTWVYPGETHVKNESRVKSNLGKKTTNLFTDDEVMQYRKMYVDKTAKEIYELSDKRTSFDNFSKMLRGRNYKNLPYYSKTKKEWIYK